MIDVLSFDSMLFMSNSKCHASYNCNCIKDFLGYNCNCITSPKNVIHPLYYGIVMTDSIVGIVDSWFLLCLENE